MIYSIGANVKHLKKIGALSWRDQPPVLNLGGGGGGGGGGGLNTYGSYHLYNSCCMNS